GDSWHSVTVRRRGRPRGPGAAPAREALEERWRRVWGSPRSALPTRRFPPDETLSPPTCRSLEATMIDLILKRFETPDEVREMDKGRYEVVRIGGITIGRASYEPGWRWSVHVGPRVGQSRCSVEHVGLVVAGTATAAFDDGTVRELTAGTLFYI